jgi:hypothetical protein
VSQFLVIAILVVSLNGLCGFSEPSEVVSTTLSKPQLRLDNISPIQALEAFSFCYGGKFSRDLLDGRSASSVRTNEGFEKVSLARR